MIFNKKRLSHDAIFDILVSMTAVFGLVRLICTFPDRYGLFVSFPAVLLYSACEEIRKWRFGAVSEVDFGKYLENILEISENI